VQHPTRIVEKPTLAPTVYFDCPVKVVKAILQNIVRCNGHI